MHNTCITCISHAHHMFITCTPRASYVHNMYTICKPHAHHMYTTCTYTTYVHTTCIPHVDHNILCISHVHYVYTRCIHTTQVYRLHAGIRVHMHNRTYLYWNVGYIPGIDHKLVHSHLTHCSLQFFIKLHIVKQKCMHVRNTKTY